MIRFILAAAMLITPLAAPAQTIEAADGDWTDIPKLLVKGKSIVANATAKRIEAIARSRKCPSIERGRHNVEVDLEFLLLFGDQGAVERVVIQRIDCPEVESLMGTAVMMLAKQGTYAPGGQGAAGWYRGNIAFSSAL